MSAWQFAEFIESFSVAWSITNVAISRPGIRPVIASPDSHRNQLRFTPFLADFASFARILSSYLKPHSDFSFG